MAILSNPIGSITLFLFLYAVGRIIAKKTKGICVEALFLSLIYAAGFISGVIPNDSLEVTGIPALMNAFGTMLLVTNLGTMIELSRFLREWKTVAICFGGLAVLAVLFCTLGILFFGREYALTAIAPVSGGIVAAGMISAAAEAAGKMDFGAFASLLCSLQTFVGVPASAYLMSRYCDKIVQKKAYSGPEVDSARKIDLRLIKHMPAVLNEESMMVARLLMVTLLGYFISVWTKGALPAAVVVLVLGIIGTETGFLERQTLAKAGYMNFLIMGLILILPYGFRTLTADAFGDMILPILFFLVIGAAGLMIGGFFVGKILRLDGKLSAAVALSAMFGYPLTQIIVDNVVNSYNIPQEEKEKLSGMVMPQMIIAGFTTVTIASVAIAGFLAPVIFR